MTGITAGRSKNLTLREVNKVKWITTTGIITIVCFRNPCSRRSSVFE